MTRKRSIGLLASLVLWSLAVLAIAGIVHIISILLMPRLASHDAFSRLATVTETNRMVLLPTREPGSSMLPFEDPAMAVGVCRFDLKDGALRVRTALPPDALLLLSFHGRHGQIFYSMTDRGAARGRLDVIVATRDQLDDIESRDSDEELPQELRLEAPTSRGFIVVRALAERPSQMDDARARVSAVTCGS